jgi:hypothetical protein
MISHGNAETKLLLFETRAIGDRIGELVDDGAIEAALVQAARVIVALIPAKWFPPTPAVRLHVAHYTSTSSITPTLAVPTSSKPIDFHLFAFANHFNAPNINCATRNP